MGSHKHGVSGRPGPRPALKRFLAEFFNEEVKRRTKRRSKMYSSLQEAVQAEMSRIRSQRSMMMVDQANGTGGDHQRAELAVFAGDLGRWPPIVRPHGL